MGRPNCAQGFLDYRKDDPSSFRLPHEFSVYPQLAFQLAKVAVFTVVQFLAG